MNNGTRFLFAAPALIAALFVGWLIAAGHGYVPGPVSLAQKIVCPLLPDAAQNTGFISI